MAPPWVPEQRVKLQWVNVYSSVLSERWRNVPVDDVSQEEKEAVVVYSDDEILQSWLEWVWRWWMAGGGEWVLQSEKVQFREWKECVVMDDMLDTIVP